MGFRGYWDAHEEEQLRRGVQKFGIGSWERIRHDPEFKVLKGRTGVQLKDKWRNLVKFQHVGREEAGRAPVRSFRGGYRRRLARPPKADGADGSSDDEDDGGGRGPRAQPVREPEPLNDFERARLENIRRNQEALAALMGGVEAIAPKINEAVAPTPRRRSRPAANGDTDEVRALRQQKAAAEDELEQAEQDLAEADAAITRAEAAFAAGSVPENALDDALNAKDASQQTVEDARGRVEAATVALEAALAERGETRKRSGRAEPSAPERASARVASRPKKTYAEDDAFSDDDEFRDGGLGRVIEDRRFGIYDARRYRMPDADGEDAGEDDAATTAVVVKSYRDSATFKRRHGLPLSDVPAAPQADADGPEAGTKDGAPAARKRPRAGEPASPADAAKPASGKRAKMTAPPPPAAAAAPAPKSRSGRPKATQNASAQAAASPPPAGAQPPKKKKSGTRPTKAAREAAAAAAAAVAAAATATVAAVALPPAHRAHAPAPPAGASGARTEDTQLWRLQFVRGWGRHALRTALQNVPAAGPAEPDALAPPRGGRQDVHADFDAAQPRSQSHPAGGAAGSLGGGGSAAWGAAHGSLLPPAPPAAGDDSDVGGEGGDDTMLMTVPWHIGAE